MMMTSAGKGSAPAHITSLWSVETQAIGDELRKLHEDVAFELRTWHPESNEATNAPCPDAPKDPQSSCSEATYVENDGVCSAKIDVATRHIGGELEHEATTESFQSSQDTIGFDAAMERLVKVHHRELNDLKKENAMLRQMMEVKNSMLRQMMKVRRFDTYAPDDRDIPAEGPHRPPRLSSPRPVEVMAPLRASRKTGTATGGIAPNQNPVILHQSTISLDEDSSSQQSSRDEDSVGSQKVGQVSDKYLDNLQFVDAERLRLHHSDSNLLNLNRSEATSYRRSSKRPEDVSMLNDQAPKLWPEERKAVKECSFPSNLGSASTGLKSINIKLREIWTEGAGADGTRDLTAMINMATPPRRSLEEVIRRKLSVVDYLVDKLEFQKGFCTPLHPSSRRKLSWDLLGASALIYDLLTMPLVVFGPNPTPFTIFMAWFTQVFWNIDILVSFHSGYWEKGDVLVQTHRNIAIHYLRTWFGFDVLIVGVDWLFFAMSQSEGKRVQAGKVLRVVKEFRLLRILRSLKFFKMFHVLEEMIQSDMLSVYLGMCKSITMLLVYCHFIACGWYYVGDATGSSGWVSLQSFGDQAFGYKYLRSLHWALAQLGVGSGDIIAVTLAEYSFSILVMLVNLLVFSVLVSCITNALSTVQAEKEEKSRNWLKLRRFCKQSSISRKLQVRVINYLEFKQSIVRRISSGQVRYLEDLSAPLRAELMFEVHKPCFSVHMLFNHLCKKSEKLMHLISDKAISQLSFASQDAVFSAGHVAAYCYFGMSGGFRYKHVTVLKSKPVDAGQWISEHALWVHWIHLGDMSTTSEAEVLLINVEDFCSTMTGHVGDWKMVCIYAELFADNLKDLDAEPLSDTNQISVDSPLFAKASSKYNLIDNFAGPNIKELCRSLCFKGRKPSMQAPTSLAYAGTTLSFR